MQQRVDLEHSRVCQEGSEQVHVIMQRQSIHYIVLLPCKHDKHFTLNSFQKNKPGRFSTALLEFALGPSHRYVLPCVYTMCTIWSHNTCYCGHCVSTHAALVSPLVHARELCVLAVRITTDTWELKAGRMVLCNGSNRANASLHDEQSVLSLAPIAPPPPPPPPLQFQMQAIKP